MLQALKIWNLSKRRAGAGNLSLTAAIAVVPFAMIVAVTTELVALTSERALMQSAADAAALSGAQNLTLVGASARQSTSDVEQFAMAQVGEFAARATVSFRATQGSDGTYTVEGLAIRSSFFGDLVPPGGFRIEVKSIAESMQVQPLCVIGDDATVGGKAITAANESSIRARNCIVHANSNFELTQSATVEAGSPRATGVASGSGFTPAANSGALKLNDPFRGRAIAPPADCTTVPDGGLRVISAGTVNLEPGIHRTEYNMVGNSILKLQPGEHYFCKGLKLRGNGRLEGDDVLLMFTGGNALTANETSSVSLSGRRSGFWAGFVMVATRGNYANTTIASNNVDKLLGTIYLPVSRLIVSAKGEVAESSEWSVVVARNINLSNKARLVINSDYEGSPVPVPIGVGNQAGGTNVPLRLRE